MSWPNLHSEVLVRTGRHLNLDSSSTVAQVVDAVYQAFRVDQDAAGMGTD
jgi:hypothetical protein